MIIRAAVLSILTLSCASVVGVAMAGDAGLRQPVLVELYTSQGCSDCPPADRILVDLARRSDVIALSFPITYWDMLGWKDTLASDSNTLRQKAYAEKLGRAATYTPQVILDGVEDVVGNQRHSILSAVTRHYAMRREAEPIFFEASYDDRNLTVDISGAVPEGVGAGNEAVIWLMPILSYAEVAVGGGENVDRTLSYANVVRDIRQVGTWDGSERTFQVPLSLNDSTHDAVAVILQSRDHGQVFAARLLRPEN
jgi:hypothetical protein